MVFCLFGTNPNGTPVCDGLSAGSEAAQWVGLLSLGSSQREAYRNQPVQSAFCTPGMLHFAFAFSFKVRKQTQRGLGKGSRVPDVRVRVEISIQVPLNLKLPCDMPFMVAN